MRGALDRKAVRDGFLRGPANWYGAAVKVDGRERRIEGFKH